MKKSIMKRLEKNINMFKAKHEHVFEKHEHVLAASPQCFSKGFTVAGKPALGITDETGMRHAADTCFITPGCCKQLSRDEIFEILKERM
ncbi:MAG: hypothetical protein K2F69_07170 [Bacteroidaceae bacterium]|nr:hypothetical protein [Bacteroidaceae bacterium]